MASCPTIFMGLALVHFQKYWLLIENFYFVEKQNKENIVDSGILKICDELDLWPWPPPPPPWVCPWPLWCRVQPMLVEAVKTNMSLMFSFRPWVSKIDFASAKNSNIVLFYVLNFFKKGKTINGQWGDIILEGWYVLYFVRKYGACLNNKHFSYSK